MVGSQLLLRSQSLIGQALPSPVAIKPTVIGGLRGGLNSRMLFLPINDIYDINDYLNNEKEENEKVREHAIATDKLLDCIDSTDEDYEEDYAKGLDGLKKLWRAEDQKNSQNPEIDIETFTPPLLKDTANHDFCMSDNGDLTKNFLLLNDALNEPAQILEGVNNSHAEAIYEYEKYKSDIEDFFGVAEIKEELNSESEDGGKTRPPFNILTVSGLHQDFNLNNYENKNEAIEAIEKQIGRRGHGLHTSKGNRFYNNNIKFGATDLEITHRRDITKILTMRLDMLLSGFMKTAHLKTDQFEIEDQDEVNQFKIEYQDEVDLLLKALEGINPSAARAARVLAKKVESLNLYKTSTLGDLLRSGEKVIGPISGVVYRNPRAEQIANQSVYLAGAIATAIAIIQEISSLIKIIHPIPQPSAPAPEPKNNHPAPEPKNNPPAPAPKNNPPAPAPEPKQEGQEKPESVEKVEKPEPPKTNIYEDSNNGKINSWEDVLSNNKDKRTIIQPVHKDEVKNALDKNFKCEDHVTSQSTPYLDGIIKQVSRPLEKLSGEEYCNRIYPVQR